MYPFLDAQLNIPPQLINPTEPLAPPFNPALTPLNPKFRLINRTLVIAVRRLDLRRRRMQSQREVEGGKRRCFREQVVRGYQVEGGHEDGLRGRGVVPWDTTPEEVEEGEVG